MDEVRSQPYVITLLRHGESLGNAEARWQGQSDYPLTETGRAQASSLAERWKSETVEFDWILTSPLLRAKETADIIGSGLNLPVECDPIWMERNNGVFSGLTNIEVHQNFTLPEFFTPYDPVGRLGEGDWQLFLRAGQALQQLLTRNPGRYLIVSHGGLLNQFMHAVLGIAPQANNSGVRFRFENTSYAELTYYPHQHRWTIGSLNDHAHWR